MTKVASLSLEIKRKLLMVILESRHGDLREENLNRQGKGHFHVSGEGHESLAAIGMLMQADDYVCPYYRDRGLVLGRGVTTGQLALDYMARAESSSHGRQMPSHYSYRDLNIWSVPTPTGSQLLPACGMAWGMQMDAKKSLVVATAGDAATRQGDFFETICFARERKLPMLIIVEDNGYGISTPTREKNPLALNVLASEEWTLVDGWEVEQLYHVAVESMKKIREGGGPVFLWVKLERLSSHTSSDDQSIYRSAEELATLSERDPLLIFKAQMIEDGLLTEDEFSRLDNETKEAVRQSYLDAEKAENPLPTELETNIFSAPPELAEEIFKPGRYRMGDTINKTLRAGLDSDPRRIIFGEDVEDPKGGVFTLTKNLSTDFPGQVFNSPLAESTILGVACGLASYGRRPIFELQFIDFVYPGWNQLVTNLATLRWRTFGKWTCPAVIYAPYGAYLPGGSLWHSQANEAAIAHYPGLSVVIPSTPEDAAGLLWTAMHGEDPLVFLIPKHLLWAEREVKEAVRSVPIGHARRRLEGSDVTLIAWGNTMEKALEAIEQLGTGTSVDLIDLRSIVPWDREMIEESVRKTGRLVIVQEDTENCSVGQMIISHLAGRPDVWSQLVAPPVLVSKGNVMIGYNPIYEYAALPDTPRIMDAIRRVMAMTAKQSAAEGYTLPSVATELPPILGAGESSLTGAHVASEVIIKVPVMGEGIRSARIVTLNKKAGDQIALDEPLCEVETEKAVYPIESSVIGVLKEWRVKPDDEVNIGQDVCVVTVDTITAAAYHAAQGEADAGPSARAPLPPSLQQLQQAHVGTEAPVREERRNPALSPAITRRLESVVPANIQLSVKWRALRAARDAARRRDGANAASPSLMIAWCATRAMEKHAGFRCVVLKDGTIVERGDFDLGFAVALEGDRLATAVIHHAGKLGWTDFSFAYIQALTATRAGTVEDVQSPLNITSLGAFGVEAAIPIVVPPAVGTLFIGTAHEHMINDGGVVYPAEIITLSLTFDHRVVNGAGAAAFLQEVKRQLEGFVLPD